MKIDLHKSDIDEMAILIAEKLRPLLCPDNANTLEDVILDVKSLASYLKVKERWVYQQIHLKQIPYAKCGKYPRFRRSEIDEWLAKNGSRPGKKNYLEKPKKNAADDNTRGGGKPL
jgi:excisionase family DNA binding protein